MNTVLNIVRINLSLLGLLIGLGSFGQDRTIQVGVENQIPAGWIVRDTASGDLNKDGLADLILVAQSDNKADYKTDNDSFGSDSINANKRLIYIFLNGQKGLKLFSKVDDIIPEHVSPTMDDPYAGISINNGILQVGYYFWANAGSWYMYSTDYKFRFQNGDFYLIGIEHDNTHRGSGERETISVNFSTRKVNIQKFNPHLDDDKATSSEWKTFELEKLYKIPEVIPTNIKVLDNYL
ncbi:hypothetical protein OO013_16240 [Mangrovivirga sp. M17]|uniref:VCBS repeat-containing protein n=1 Tax=Mangrovivirga halotolerans TaxID=2993936 RepID=A0ABT3RUH8_9BACT|nr:hypothetical protein [Mangrovivirga halotolerans]MCX2745430.1 hypothetical protein [Mangrovivirga halotolerans]